MGYTTTFNGHFTITPALPAKVIAKINAFCGERHEGRTSTPVGEIWCNWEVSEDGESIQWNGSEKAYGMYEWIQYLAKTYIIPQGCYLDGTIRAHGEEDDDQWKMTATGSEAGTLFAHENRPHDW